ncbi:hypothetical protein FEM03_14690 [Phragmitibacter flavus]|uniref:Toxin-antitoxin system YwqK family antitoxin n=1 Tax=Phragmitibacter flavus TaxID=2576071 RepID=A0A5R8KCE6_9BACT|nr:hypothetical protein [Phragmitibacter flavus]TLD69976.1 hypothetical protein FEM03_14690 [Phragmitibacter flavus]
MSKFSFVALLLGLVVALSACGEGGPKGPKLVHGPSLEERADGLFYEKGAEKPFTGTQNKVDKESGKLRAETQFENGQKHGWDRRWYRDNLDQMHRQWLWVRGEPAFFWSWWPNGVMRELASQRSGKEFGRADIAYGSYVKWFDSGKIQFKARYDEKFFWQGHVLDYNDAGQLMWDGEFKDGVFVKGIRPPEGSGEVKKVTPPPADAPEEE